MSLHLLQPRANKSEKMEWDMWRAPNSLKDFRYESQKKNNGRVRSRSTFPGSQHFEGVEGRVGAPGWDYEELTSFNYTHGPAQNQHKVVSA